MAEPATVIVHYDEHGDMALHVLGNVRVFCVDESCPNDRVYEWLSRATPEDIAAIIPEGTEIGSNQDERHAAIAHVVEAHMSDKPRLSVVAERDGGGKA